MGRPMERVLRQTVVAMRLGTAAGVEQATRTSTYYTSLLTWVGCATETTEVAALFGDETEVYADTRDEDLGGITLAAFVARRLGRGKSGFRRIGMVGKFVATGGRSVQQMMMSHCREASDFAEWLELGPEVCEPLLQAFERWDGRGVPGSAAPMVLLPPSAWCTWPTSSRRFTTSAAPRLRFTWPGSGGARSSIQIWSTVSVPATARSSTGSRASPRGMR